MKNYPYYLVLVLFSLHISCQSQDNSFIQDPDEYLRKGESVPEVLLVGTYHFAYPNLDAHKTAEEDEVNVLSDQRQKEMAELNEYIAQFKPTKIIVERGSNTGWLMRQYEDWLAGKEELRAGEIYQIAFQQMKENGLDTIYGCDRWHIMGDMYSHADSLVFEKFLNNIFEDYDWQSEDEMDKRYDDWYDADDKYPLEHTMLETFMNMNSEKNIQRMHGAYLVGDFKLEDDKGADALTLLWYSRNLRIFRAIQKIETSPDDRILVLFGAGHAAILKEQFVASPEYDFVEFNILNSYEIKE